MAVRATESLQEALIRPFTVATSKTVTEGFRVKFSGADNAIENCGAGELGFAIARASGVAADVVNCVLEGNAVVRVKVGTGGATRGVYAMMAADGYTDQGTTDGATVRYLAGIFMQSGVVGDMVGMLVGVTAPFSSA